jgi:hypothetical protein
MTPWSISARRSRDSGTQVDLDRAIAYASRRWRRNDARRECGSHRRLRKTALSEAVEPANASFGEPSRQPESREMG